jgi:hypothetical protein
MSRQVHRLTPDIWDLRNPPRRRTARATHGVEAASDGLIPMNLG